MSFADSKPQTDLDSLNGNCVIVIVEATGGNKFLTDIVTLSSEPLFDFEKLESHLIILWETFFLDVGFNSWDQNRL